MATTSLGEILVKLGIDAAEFDRGLAGVQRQLKATAANISSMGRALTAGITAPLAAVGALAAREFGSYEEALAGVARETGAGVAQVEELGARMSDLATKIPVARNELLAIAEAAGELGVPIGGLEELTETAARFGSAAKIAGDVAVTSLVKLSRAFGEPIDEANRLGSAILALQGDEGAILDIAKGVAATSRAIGLATAETLAFAAAVAKLGPDTGGAAALQRLFEQISEATAEGGRKLAAFAEIAGTTGSALRQAFQTDAAGAIVSILEGLDRLRASGQSVVPMLGAIGLGSARSREALLALASSTGDLREGLASASDAFRRGNLVVTESEKFYATLNSQLTKLRNAFDRVFAKLGEALAPALEAGIEKAGKLADRLARLVERFNEADRSTKVWVGALAAVAAGIGPVLLGLGLLTSAAASSITGIKALVAALATLRTGLLALFVTAGPVLGTFTLNPIGLAVVGLAAATAVGIKAWRDWQRATKDAADAAASAAPDLAKLGERFQDVAAQAGSAATRVRTAAQGLTAAGLQLERFRVSQDIARLPSLGLAPQETAAIGQELARRRDEIDVAIQKLTPPMLRIAVGIDEQTRREALAAAGFAAEEIEAALAKATAAGSGAGTGVSQAAQDMAQALRLVEQQAALLGPSFDVAGERAGILREALRAMLEEGLAPTAPAVERVVAELGALNQALASREGAEAFRAWIADVNREIASVERGGVEALEGQLVDLDRRLRDFDLSPAEQELVRIRDALADTARAIEASGGTITEEFKRVQAEIEGRLPELQKQMEATTLDISGAVGRSVRSIATGILEGNRQSLDAMRIFRDAAIGIVADLWSRMIEDKLKFLDKPFEANFLKDLPAIVQRGADAAAGIFRNVLGALGVSVGADVEADVAAKVGTVDVPAPDAPDAPRLPGIDLSGIRRTLAKLSESVQLAFASIRDGVLAALRGLPEAAARAFGTIVETLRRIPELVDLSGVGRLFARVSDTVQAAFARLGRSILAVVEGVGPGVRGAFDVALRFLGGLPAQVGVLVAGIGEPLLAALRALPTRAGDLAEGVGEALASGLGRAFNAVRSLVTDFGGELVEGFEGALGAVTGLFASLPGELGRGLAAARSFGADVLGALGEALGSAAALAQRFGTGFVEAVESGLGTALEAVRSLGSDAPDGEPNQGLAGTLTDAFQAIRELPRLLGRVFGDGLAVVDEFGSDLFASFTRTFSGALNAVLRFGSGLVEGLGVAFDTALQLVQRLIAAMASADVAEAGSSILQGLGSIFGSIGGAVGGGGTGTVTGSAASASSPTAFTGEGAGGFARARSFPSLDLDQLAALSERSAGGGGGTSIVVHNHAAEAGFQASVHETQGPDLMRQIEVIIERKVAGSMAGGSLRTSIQQLHGLQPQPSMR